MQDTRIDPREIRGLISATVTPFDGQGQIDFPALRHHLERVASTPGLYGVCVSGHAGEVLALTSEENSQVIKTARALVPRTKKLVAGIHGQSIAALVREGQIAKEAGADMLLVLPLFDHRPYRHLAHQPDVVYGVYERLNREIDLPMILFQYPDATGCSYSVAALERIADLPNVVGIKAASVTPTKYAELNDALSDRLAILAACDAPALFGMLLHNAPGALLGISVAGTDKWVELIREATTGSADKAKALHNAFAVPLMDAIYEYQLQRTPCSTTSANKEALVQLGEIKSSWVRPPAISLTPARKQEIREGLQRAGLIAR
ncbi:MAG: dihydrodipicolinate synthase family protein [Betaproteobacteria bacterium]|nr:dihydrodipicolinate synthase family protein [Betaproteobacteria bacterium]